MKLLNTLIAGAVVAGAVATGVAAQTFVKYGETQGWSVHSDPANATCVAETQRDGLIVQMGVLHDSIGYIGVFTNEAGVEAQGETGTELVIWLDDNAYKGEETVLHRNAQGYTGAMITATNPQFIADIENKNNMKVVDTERVFNLSLAGTKAAIAMARECIAAQ